MLFKNDSQIKRFNQEQPHFSIRKLSVGAASVLIGISLMGYTSQNVKADTVSEPATEETTKTDATNSDQQTTNVEEKNASNTEQTLTVEKQNSTLAAEQTSQSSTVPTSKQTNTEVINEYPKTNAAQGQNLNASTKPSDSQSTDTQNKALESLDEAKKAPAVQPTKGNGESNGEDIKGINSKITITGENKYTGKTSESSAKGVEVNPSITKDLNMVITIENNSDTDKNISTSYPDNAYALPAYNGRKNANIVVDSSRVTINDNQVTFGGNYQDAGLTITNWDAANEHGSSGFNHKEETIAKIVNDPSLIGGFQISGILKAHQIATIIVPLKVVNTDQRSGGNKFERQYGQAVVVSLDPEGGRSAGDYTSVNSSVDTLVDNNIANLADNNGNLTLNADVTNGGLLTHQETLEFNLNNIANFNNDHQVHVVLDHSKELNFDWAGISNNDIQYKVNGVYKTASQMTDADWENVTAIKVNAGLASGATGKISIPVKVKNADQIKNDLLTNATANQSYLRQNTVSINTSVDSNSIGNPKTTTYYYELPADATMNAVNANIAHQKGILPTVLTINAEGNRHYVDIPEIQDLMPYLDKEDFIYQNIGHTDSSKVLFTDGTLKIKLDKIFNALKDHGYSVNIKDDNGNKSTWPLYSYNVSASGNINLYVQLQNIFDTKDLNLTPNDTWNSNDSLISAKVEFYNPVTMRQTGLEDLKANGNYTYDLYDPSGKQIAKDVPVGQNIGKLSVGRYRVVYHYEINGNEMVSKEAYINVSKPVQPTTPPKQPTNPPAPVTPEQPTVPENPTSPVQPSSPSNSNVTPLPEITPTRPVAPSAPDINTDNDTDTVRPHAEKVSANNNKKTVTPKNMNVINSKVVRTTPVSNVHSQTNSQNVTKGNESKNTLPQTGERKEASAAIVGLLAATVGILGLAITKHKARN